VNGSIAAMPLATGVPLIGLSIAVLTLSFDRGRWWVQWWRKRASRRQQWQRLRRDPAARARQREDWERQMRFGEPLLEAAVVLGPLLGLTGTVLALMGVLSGLGRDLTLPPGASLQGYGQVLMSTLVGLVVCLIASTTLLTNQGLRSWQLERLARHERRQGPQSPEIAANAGNPEVVEGLP
jgi:biopolymer transport protein ExbB